MKKWFSVKTISVVLIVLLCGVGGYAGWSFMAVDDPPPPCTLNVEQRYMFGKYTTPAQKAAYWQTHLQNVLNGTTLHGSQPDIVRAAQELAVEGAFGGTLELSSLSDSEDAWGILYADILANFTPEEMSVVFEQLPEYTTPSLSSADEEDLLASPNQCSCSSIGSSCGIWSSYWECAAVACRRPTGLPGNPDPGGCGPMWIFNCDRLCRRDPWM